MHTSDIAPSVCIHYEWKLDRLELVNVFLSVFVPRNSFFILNSSIPVVLVQGYGIASGNTQDPRFPGGTVSMQVPFFQLKGLDLSSYFFGTLNVDISPYSFELKDPIFSVSNIKWSEELPAENFSFFECKIEKPSGIGRDVYSALVYWPHPSTKPGFIQPENNLEILSPFIPDLNYGDPLILTAEKNNIFFRKWTSISIKVSNI